MSAMEYPMPLPSVRCGKCGRDGERWGTYGGSGHRPGDPCDAGDPPCTGLFHRVETEPHKTRT
jgi:hypothetical protein